MSTQVVNIAVEGISDVEAARAVVRAAGLVPSPHPHVMNGKGNLDKRLPAFSNAAKFEPWFVLRDLDNAPCAPAVVDALAPTRPRLLLLRIAVRSIESWLLADRRRIASFLGVSTDLVPTRPDDEADAKRVLVALAARSRRRDIRDDMAPQPSSHARVGPNYSARLNEFAEGVWDPRAASLASPSLERCLSALAKVAATRPRPLKRR